MEANSEGKKAKAAKRASRESEKQGGEPPKIPDKGDKKGKTKWPSAPKGDDPIIAKIKSGTSARNKKSDGEPEPSPNTGPSAHLAQDTGNGLFAGMSGYFSQEFSKVKVADATSEEVKLQERILKNAVDRAIRTFNTNLGQD